jgi:hypothetical protein
MAKQYDDPSERGTVSWPGPVGWWYIPLIWLVVVLASRWRGHSTERRTDAPGSPDHPTSAEMLCFATSPIVSHVKEGVDALR